MWVVSRRFEGAVAFLVKGVDSISDQVTAPSKRRNKLLTSGGGTPEDIVESSTF